MRNEPALYIRTPLSTGWGPCRKRTEGILLRRHDGSVKVFDTMTVSKEMFL
jgi:hypothetical protein